MKTIILKKINSDKDSIEYQNQDSNETIKIIAGKAAWTWYGETKSPLLKKLFNKILNKYIQQGIDQHDYKGGFDEAVGTLEIAL